VNHSRELACLSCLQAGTFCDSQVIEPSPLTDRSQLTTCYSKFPTCYRCIVNGLICRSAPIPPRNDSSNLGAQAPSIASGQIPSLQETLANGITPRWHVGRGPPIPDEAIIPTSGYEEAQRNPDIHHDHPPSEGPNSLRLPSYRQLLKSVGLEDESQTMPEQNLGSNVQPESLISAPVPTILDPQPSEDTSSRLQLAADRPSPADPNLECEYCSQSFEITQYRCQSSPSLRVSILRCTH
jgi:hypothetical protein